LECSIYPSFLSESQKTLDVLQDRSCGGDLEISYSWLESSGEWYRYCRL